jgi:hypothetical protein
MCDNDVAGHGEAVEREDDRVAEALGPGFAPGAHVVHDAFGDGVVEDVAEGALAVRFDTGIRMLDAGLVAEGGVLRRAGV